MAATQSNSLTRAESATVARALGILKRRMHRDPVVLGSPGSVRQFLRLQYGIECVEVFRVIFLDAQNRLIACEEMSRGTLTQTSVFPREIVRAALRHNAAAVMFAHNHPSGVAEPSHADETLTQALKQALALVDVRSLDHFVVGDTHITSFAERGLMEERPTTEVRPQRKARRRHAGTVRS